MLNKKSKFLIVFLSIIFLFPCFLIKADQLYTTETAWEDYENVYRPTPILLLHGFGPGKPQTWNYLSGKLTEDFGKYYYNIGLPASAYYEYLVNAKDAQGKPNPLFASYLEKMNFNDPCGSVDTYLNGNPGWADKVNNAVSNILLRYNETDKVILICHSMGGLAGRYYMQALGGDGNTDKYVSIDTPHCGAVLADIANTIEAAQVGSLIFGSWGGFLFAAITEVINQSAVKIGDIDIHGDAVNDMDPDGEFITNLISMGTGSGSKSRCIVGQIGSAKNFILFGSYYGGDGVVSVRSQQAIDKNGYTTWNFYDTCVVTASHSDAPKNSRTYDQILKWVDKERPELGLIRVLESEGTPEAEENNLSTSPEGDWGEKDTKWTEHIIGEDSQPFLLDLDKYGRAYIEGKVDKECLPATTKVDIKVYKEGKTTSVWENTPETSLLKPYAEKEPAPAGFRYEVLFAKDKDTAPEPGVYEIKVFVENPAGLKSEVKTAKVRIGEGHYFHVQLSPSYVETGSPVSQTQTFTIKVQCYNYGTSVNPPPEGMVNKLSGTESYVKNNDGEWEKEKINPDCIPPEAGWTKSDYNGEVSLGGYGLYAGGEKLETLELVDGAGTISAVIKAEDGNIGDNHLFLIISASDGTGSGNDALAVNSISPQRFACQRKSVHTYASSPDAVWSNVVSAWNSATWGNWGHGNSLYFYQEIREHTNEYGVKSYSAWITGKQIKLRADLRGYSPADFSSAKLVIMPKKVGGAASYYNPQGWAENKINYVRDMKSELGTNWVSEEYFAPPYTPSRPAIGRNGTGWQDFGQDEHGNTIYYWRILLTPKN